MLKRIKSVLKNLSGSVPGKQHKLTELKTNLDETSKILVDQQLAEKMLLVLEKNLVTEFKEQRDNLNNWRTINAGQDVDVRNLQDLEENFQNIRKAYAEVLVALEKLPKNFPKCEKLINDYRNTEASLNFLPPRSEAADRNETALYARIVREEELGTFEGSEVAKAELTECYVAKREYIKVRKPYWDRLYNLKSEIIRTLTQANPEYVRRILEADANGSKPFDIS